MAYPIADPGSIGLGVGVRGGGIDIRVIAANDGDSREASDDVEAEAALG
jgi:hypothetical protein